MRAINCNSDLRFSFHYKTPKSEKFVVFGKNSAFFAFFPSRFRQKTALCGVFHGDKNFLLTKMGKFLVIYLYAGMLFNVSMAWLDDDCKEEIDLLAETIVNAIYFESS